METSVFEDSINALFFVFDGVLGWGKTLRGGE